jgi:hypothetical protein
MGCQPGFRARYLRNFPLQSSRVLINGISHWNPEYEQFGAVPRPTAMFGVRNGWTVLARKSHASVRRLDVPLGRKLSVGSRQQHCRHWIVTSAPRHSAYRQSLATPHLGGPTLPRLAREGALCLSPAPLQLESFHGGRSAQAQQASPNPDPSHFQSR